MTAPNSEQSATLAALAHGVFNQLFQAIVSHESGVIAGDVEAVHDMRVASRRLRVALSNFSVCYQSEQRRRLRQQLSALADALGAVRDLDVMIETLQVRSKSCSEEHAVYLRDLIRRLHLRRKRRRKQLIEFLNGQQYAEFKAEAAALVNCSEEDSKAASINSNGEGIQS